MTLKEQIKFFINLNYRNEITKATAASALKHIESLDEIDIDKINEIIDNLEVVENTKSTFMAYINKFVKTMSIELNKNYKYHKLNRYNSEAKAKDWFTDEELSILHKELDNFNHNGFKLAWILLEENGCRISELTNVPWKTINQTNYEWFGSALKKGKTRIFTVPQEYTGFFELNIDNLPAKNTIQNLFNQFRKFVVAKNPTFQKQFFTAHWLRVNKITRMFLAGIPIQEIIIYTGHQQVSTIVNHYIKTNKEQMRQIYQRSKLPVLDGINLTKHKHWITNQNSEIIIQQSKIETLELEIQKLQEEKKELNEKIKIAQFSWIGNGFKDDFMANKSKKL